MTDADIRYHAKLLFIKQRISCLPSTISTMILCCTSRWNIITIHCFSKLGVIFVKMYSIRRTGVFVKLFLIITATGLFMYAVLAFCSFYFAYTLSGTREPYKSLSEIDEFLEEKFTYESDLKYILLWTVPDYTEYKFGDGRAPFIKGRCLYSNCYITTSKNVLDEGYTKFEAIIFDINVVRSWQKKYMPKKRSSRQKYVFYSMEASDYSPVCNVLADNYFNWTWSYKLYSDIVNPFILVKKLKGDLVAPSIAVSWITNMSRVTGKELEDLERKSKAVIWVINKCDSRIDRMVFVKRLKLALQKHSLELDIFGCDYIKCPYKYCEKLIKNDYYFFLSYEYSTADDFVSEDVLKAYENDAVPIVLGGANYNQ